MDINNFLLRRDFNPKIRRKCYLRMEKQLRFNVDETFALQSLEQQFRKRNKRLANVFAHVVREKARNKKIGVTLAPYITSSEAMLLQSCEHAGTLDDGFRLASKIIEATTEIYSSIRSAFAYPIVLFLLFIAILCVVSFMVIPNFSLVSDPNTWTGSAYALYAISNLITSPFGVAIALIFCAMIFLVGYSLPNLTGKIRIKLDKYIPYSIYRLTVGATWLFTMACLLRAGMTPEDILRGMLQSETTSLYLKERISAILACITNEGMTFGDALSAIKMDFPDDVIVDDIKIYLTFGDDGTLYQLAEEWLQEGVEKIKEIASIVNTICLFLITVALGSIFIAFNDIQQTITQGV